MKVFKTCKDAKFPEYKTKDAACFDLFVCFDKPFVEGYDKNNEEIKLEVKTFEKLGKINKCMAIGPRCRALIPTGLIFDIPEGKTIRIHPRSGTSVKTGITLINSCAIIDSDYIEQTYILIVNHSAVIVVINEFDRIAQGELIDATPQTPFEEVLERPAQKTDRVGGLGSTGS
jgi:dUTP pyrophosphatase